MRVRIIPEDESGAVRYGETAGPPENGLYPVIVDNDPSHDVQHIPAERIMKAGWDEGLSNDEETIL